MPRSKKPELRKAAAGEDAAPRDRVISAAFRAFTSCGFASTTMLEIATAAKVSKRDLYANFPNKEAVLLACITERAARMQLSPDLPAPRDRKTLAAILRQVGATVIREVSDPAVTAIYRLAAGEAQRSPDVAKILNARRMANRKALAGLLAVAQASNILGPGDPQEMMEDFFALLWGDLMLGRLFGALGVPKAAEIEHRARRATQGLLKLHGRAQATADRT